MSRPRSLLSPGTALVLVFWGTGSLRAAEPAVTPMPIPVAQGVPQAGGCASCGKAGPLVGGCKSGHCGFHLGSKHRPPYVVNLCPGACFGYFQTQWRKWDDVCPYPYQGIGVTDAPKPPAPPLSPVKPGSGLGEPRLVEPKLGGMGLGTGGLPPIPIP